MQLISQGISLSTDSMTGNKGEAVCKCTVQKSNIRLKQETMYWLSTYSFIVWDLNTETIKFVQSKMSSIELLIYSPMYQLIMGFVQK